MKQQILDFVEANPNLTTKTICQRFNINSTTRFSLLTGYLLKPSKTDNRHLKPIKQDKQIVWVVSTEPIELIEPKQLGWRFSQPLIKNYLHLNTTKAWQQTLELCIKPYIK